ncbi:MAG: hypothetical protein LQ351_002108 [Letrouitia transgressa]|nr:MAG: hypothetical protein LQ351_002108 [Letrouitia transgressa]
MGTAGFSFDAATTATTVAAAFPSEIANRTFLVTGVSPTGIGSATALALAQHGPKLLILSGRKEEPVSEVIAQIHSTHSKVLCRWLPLDLSSPYSIRSAASSLLQDPTIPAIDVLINNAGTGSQPTRTVSAAFKDVEIQFATNHLGHFLLTRLLLPKLLASAADGLGMTRIVNLSSNGHRYSPVRFSDLNWTKADDDLPPPERPNRIFINERRMAEQQAAALNDTFPTPHGDAEGEGKHYVPMGAYGQSKTANLLFTVALNRHLLPQSIYSFAVHPGVIRTSLFRNLGNEEEQDEIFRRLRKEWKTLDQGAATTLVAALDPKLDPTTCGNDGSVGYYLSDCQVMPGGCAEWARNEGMAERLWEMSEELVEE